MTIPGLICINLLVGISMAYCARVQIKNLQRPVFYNRYFTVLLMFQVSLMLPVGVYFNGFYPDWSWMYLVDTRSSPMGLSVMALLGYPFSAAAGYVVGYYSARANVDWLTVLFMSFLGIVVIGLFIVGWSKISMLGTYSQFQNHINLVPISRTSLLPSMLITWAGLLVCWGYILFRFWREGHLTSAASRG